MAVLGIEGVYALVEAVGAPDEQGLVGCQACDIDRDAAGGLLRGAATAQQGEGQQAKG